MLDTDWLSGCGHVLRIDLPVKATRQLFLNMTFKTFLTLQSLPQKNTYFLCFHMFPDKDGDYRAVLSS